MNLLVGQTGCPPATDLPHELLPAAKSVWQATLEDQRPIVLTARVKNMDQQDRDEIKFIRHDLNPKLNFSKPPTQTPYVEIKRIVWDPKGGNVILVIPMGREAFRLPDAPSSTDSYTIAISSPSASIPIAAPNGAIVGTLSVAGTTNNLALQKNVEGQGCLATVTLLINPSNLLFGESFRTPSNRCLCTPTIDGAHPRNWEYSVYSFFDGTTFRVEIVQLSTNFRNANLLVPMPCLAATEELVMRAPIERLVLETTASMTLASASLKGGFLLRDI